MENRSKFIKNIITGFGGQFIAIILGLVVPRIFITSYGSDVNGLMSTIAQVFAYMALLEAGIGQAARNLLYKPMQENDIEEISDVCSIAKGYFKKCTVVYAIGVVLLSILLPLVIRTDVDSVTVVLVVLFEGLSGVISFYYIETPTIIIAVDGKSYINNNITLINKIVGYAVKILMAFWGLSIVLLQFVFFVVTVSKVLVYQIYFKKNYSWIKFKKTDKTFKLKDRSSYVLTEICWTIFSSTDMVVLSIFANTQLASVYGIYNMIFTNITLLVNAVFTSIIYLLGHTYHENIEKYKTMHDAFNSFFIGTMTVLMSVCYVLTIPFVSLYTQGITDVNYIYSSLPLLFCLIQLISWSRYTSGQLTGIAGYAKQTSYVSLIEAGINIALSILLVPKHGVLGVTIATVIALPIKVIWCTYVAEKKVMKRSYLKFISIMGVNFFFFFCVVVSSKFFMPEINTFQQFIIWGIVYTILFSTIGLTLNLVVNKDCLRFIRKYILKQ